MKCTWRRLLFLACILTVLLTGCRPLFQPKIVVSEDEFRITPDTLFATQISPRAVEMDTAPGINTSYLAIINRDGSIRAIRIQPMEVGQPVWVGKTLVAVDRKYNYFISDKTTKIEDPKPSLTTFLLDAGDGKHALALMNDGYVDDANGLSYRAYGKKISINSTETTELEGILLSGGTCNGELYAMGEATGRVKRQITTSDSANISEFVQATGTPEGREKLLGHSPASIGEADGSASPCINGELVQLNEDNAGLDWPTTAYVRLRNIKTGKVTDRPLTTSEGQRFTFKEHSLVGSSIYDRSSISGTTFNWLSSINGTYWQTNIETGATELLFGINETPEFFDNSAIEFTPRSIYMLHQGEDGIVINAYNKDDGKLTNSLPVPDLDKLTSTGRLFWRLAVAPQVP